MYRTSPGKAMMKCWGRSLDLQALRGESGAALRSKMKRKQPTWEGGRSRFTVQAKVSKACSGHLKEHEQQGMLCPRKHALASLAISFQGLNNRLFCSSVRNGDGDDPDGQARSAADSRDSGRLLERRRRHAWERSLSPLERVSQLVHEEFLSPEVRALRGSEAIEPRQQENEACETEEGSSPVPRSCSHAESRRDRGSFSEKVRDAPSRNVPFQVGDLILAEIRRRRGTEFKKLCKLTVTGVLNSSWGAVQYADIIGKLPGQMFQTTTGHKFLIRRPALEEFVLLMKRGPTISYPKDINAMLLLMDISPGDTVLEAGSGSGGMSLFLSRAVGAQGHVISYEVRKDHYNLAKKNYWNWCDAWNIGHTVEWPDNIDFINEDISTAAEDLKTVTFDAIALDMLLPQNALSVVIPNLKQGGICAVYLANVTQVIDLVEAIRMSKLTLFCEKIVEVTHRDWLVLPTTWKTGGIFKNMESTQKTDNESACCYENKEIIDEQKKDDAFISDGTKPPYIARPYPLQIGHTAFLVKLRKYNSAYSNSTSNDVD